MFRPVRTLPVEEVFYLGFAAHGAGDNDFSAVVCVDRTKSPCEQLVGAHRNITVWQVSIVK